MRTYYLPIESVCLAHYFGSALLKPAKYFANRPQDIQNRFENCLLLTTSGGCVECNCTLEIVLTDEEEEKSLIPTGDTWYLLTTSLPITRVKRIYFRDQQQRDKTLINIRMGTAFVPDSLVGKVTRFDNVSVNEAYVPDDLRLEYKDRSREIDLYDRILGSLVMMRLIREKHNNTRSYDTYLSTLAFFNQLIANELVEVGKNINSKYSALFAPTPNGYSNFVPYLKKKISIEDVKEMAQSEGQLVAQNRITRKIDLGSLERKTYILAILATYGVGTESSRDKVDGLILFHLEGVKSPMLVAQCYGYNRGYSVFNSYYRTSESNQVDVKFALDTRLDYYTIESVYQYVFNHRASGKFDYLDYLDTWCVK